MESCHIPRSGPFRSFGSGMGTWQSHLNIVYAPKVGADLGLSTIKPSEPIELTSYSPTFITSYDRLRSNIEYSLKNKTD